MNAALREQHEARKQRLSSLMPKAENPILRRLREAEEENARLRETIASLKRAGLPAAPRPRAVVRAVTEYYGVIPTDLASPSKAERFTWPRQVCCLIANELGLSKTLIGRSIGRDRSTAWHSIGVAERRLREDPRLLAEVDEIRTAVARALAQGQPS